MEGDALPLPLKIAPASLYWRAHLERETKDRLEQSINNDPATATVTLAAALIHPEVGVRLDAAALLGSLGAGYPSFASPLFATVLNDTDTSVRCRGIESLWKLARVDPSVARTHAETALADQALPVRIEAARILNSQEGPTSDLARGIVAILLTGQPTSPQPIAVASLLALADELADARAVITLLMGILPSLGQSLAESDQEIRLGVAITLVKLTSAEPSHAAPLLAVALSARRWELREAATAALRVLVERHLSIAAPLLVRAAKDASLFVRRGLAIAADSRSYGEIDESEQRYSYRIVERQRDYSPLRAAIEADPSLGNQLLTLLLADREERVRGPAAKGLWRLADKDLHLAAPLFPLAFASKNWMIRYQVIARIASIMAIAPKTATALLDQAASDSNKQVRSLARNQKEAMQQ